ncbi:MAG: hypothetical protein JW702_09160 [Clostridiales bacterium]|nr:hypothetical protein [Clostridiales bacterium]
MYNKLSPQELAERIQNIALGNKDQLKKWLIESNRRYLIFDAIHLVDSLDLKGIESFIEIVRMYAQYRCGIDSGYKKIEKNMMGEDCEVPIFLDEVLSNDEIKRLIAWLNG